MKTEILTLSCVPECRWSHQCANTVGIGMSPCRDNIKGALGADTLQKDSQNPSVLKGYATTTEGALYVGEVDKGIAKKIVFAPGEALPSVTV